MRRRWAMMIPQVMMLASSRPTITIFTTMSAWRNKVMGDMSDVGGLVIFLFAQLCFPDLLELLQPGFRLALGPAVRRKKGDRHRRLGEHFRTAHDCLMNDAVGGAQRTHLAQEQQIIVEPRWRPVFDRDFRDGIDALPAFQLLALLD